MSPSRNLRRQSAAFHPLIRLAAGPAVLLCCLLAAIAGLASPSQAANPDAGLFGSADPTYDGAFRQSVGLLGLAAVGAPAPRPAVDWLGAQQCLDGTFEAYRVSIRTACRQPDVEEFLGPDSNSTALAAMALRAHGRQQAAQRATDALIAAQNPDGGWGYILSSPSEANSTGLVLSALSGLPGQPAVTARARARAFLATQQVACTKAGDFGLSFPPSPAANALASGQALIGIAGTAVPFEPPARYGSLAGTACTSSMRAKVSAYLDSLLVRTAGRVPSTLDPADIDWNATASAVIGLGAAQLGRAGVRAGVSALEANVREYGFVNGTGSPAAIGALLLVADVAGRDPGAFGAGRVNLVQSLLATMRR